MISQVLGALIESKLARTAGVAIVLIGVFSVQQIRLSHRGDRIQILSEKNALLEENIQQLISINNKQGLLVKETNEAVERMRAKAYQDSLTAVAQRDWAMKRFRDFERRYNEARDRLMEDSTLTWSDLFSQ